MSQHGSSTTFGRIVRIGTADGNEDQYDHIINLVDATASNDDLQTAPTNSDQSGWRQLARQATHTSVKDQLTRRKYAKWRQEQFDSKDGNIVSVEAEDNNQEELADTERNRGRRVQIVEHPESAAVDFAQRSQSSEAEPDKSKKKKKKPKKHHKNKEKLEEDAAIDILYENQRGSFFCGIPLYSHSSLLPFDPAPWATREYKPSPVNITNAQVPDPSWQWTWRHWYVDMSEDVDEDGWQYSFAFFGKFSWHGTHPWFHSFCRRRRWLRKRTKRALQDPKKPIPSSMSAAHQLNTDYFTIHSKRDRSPSITDGPKTARPDNYMSYRTDGTADEIPEDVNDIASLLKALRFATVDREKIDVVKQFVEHGGEELAYLKERIPEIMEFLVFQNSKRQLLEFLRTTARDAQLHREEHDAQDRPEGEAESRRIDNLLKAVEAADEQIKGLEYWSDRKHVMVTTEHTKSLAENPLVTIFDKKDANRTKDSMGSPSGEIRGIDTDKAGIGSETLREATYRGATLAPAKESTENEKGKGKAGSDKDGSDPEDIARLPPRLGNDQIAIPEGEGEQEKDVTLDFSQMTF